MAVPSLIQRIRDLDEDGAVQLAHALLTAERARLRLPASAVTVGLQTKAADGGIDARTTFPGTASSAFPTGPRLWQVKSGAKAPDANSELPHARGGKEREVVRLLRSRKWGYVLFWTRDPSDKTRQRLSDAFDERIRSIAPGVSTDYLTIDRIVPLCRQLPAAALPILRLDRGGLLTVEEWSRRFRGAYVQDSARDAISQAIQAHARSAARSPVLHVTGVPGVGRRRTVLEAARKDEISNQTYVAVGRIDQQLVRSIVDDHDATLVLIVAPDATTDRAELRAMADAADGRLRLVLISDRTASGVPADALEVPPLEGSAIRSLLPARTRASLVRECAGYPSVALAIAAAEPSTSGDLSALMRDPAVREAVAAVIPQPLPDGLAVLALLARIGLAGHSSAELQAVCKGLGLDQLATETALRAHAGSFVSIDGKFASIESRLIAAPMIDVAVGRFGSRLVSALAELPDVLLERFMIRIETMDSPPVTRLIEELLQTDRFKAATLAGLDARGSRLLGIAAARGPQKVLERVEALLAIRSPDDRSGPRPVHGLVPPLKALLQHDSTFAAAYSHLLALAAEDPPIPSARTTFEDAHEAGAPVALSFHDRINVAAAALEDADTVQRNAILRALCTVFRPARPGDAAQPRPAAMAPAISAARAEVWALLHRQAEQNAERRAEVGSALARSLPYSWDGLRPAAAAIAAVPWEAGTRHELARALETTVYLGWVRGSDGPAALLFKTLKTEPFELRLRRCLQGGGDNADVAAEMAVDDSALQAAAVASDGSEASAVMALFLGYATVSKRGGLQRKLARWGASPEAIAGYLAGLGAVEELQEFAETTPESSITQTLADAIASVADEQNSGQE